MYSTAELAAKRLFDVLAAVGGLIAVAPIILTVGLLVKVSSPGPILFRQTRVGRNGRPFRLLKFRTMRSGNGPLVTAQGDGRVTPVGRLLRRTKLDELPGLLNVVVGDLSLVGPRPEVPMYVALLPDAERELLSRVRPGITHPATIHFRSEEELLAKAEDAERMYVDEILPRKTRLSCDYLRGASFFSDFSVLAITALVIFVPSMARPGSPGKWPA